MTSIYYLISGLGYLICIALLVIIIVQTQRLKREAPPIALREKLSKFKTWQYTSSFRLALSEVDPVIYQDDLRFSAALIFMLFVLGGWVSNLLRRDPGSLSILIWTLLWLGASIYYYQSYRKRQLHQFAAINKLMATDRKSKSHLL